MRTLVYFLMNTGWPTSEATNLTWDRMTLDDAKPYAHFNNMKSHKDRIVAIHTELGNTPRRLMDQSQQDGGPFVSRDRVLRHAWEQVV